MQIQTGLEANFQEWREKNSDSYSSGVVRYVVRWAEMMEAEMANGTTVEACAKSTSSSADTEGITGFMYGCAVGALAKFWAHGEALRRWHNVKTQIGDEGERANETGGTLNPALLRIG